jgi:hypothetical protein
MDNKDEIIQELNLKKFGSKGWLNSKELVCQSCNRSDKAGIYFLENRGVFSCMRCSVKIDLNIYLKQIGRTDLAKGEVILKQNNSILPLFPQEIEEVEQTYLPKKKLPIGAKMIQKDEYLESRGFLPYHYENFKPCITKLDLSRKHTIIFQIFDDRGVRVAWIARSKHSKEWHKENLKKYKNGEADLVLRYDNSNNTDFSYILGGINEITEKTDTVIIVEGIFDKVNVDKELELDKQEEVKCLFTFGDSIKEPQIDILVSKKQIKNVYLLYDFGEIENSKRFGILLKKQSKKNVFVCEIDIEGCDPGDLKKQQILSILNKSVDALTFKYKKLSYVIERK